MLAGGLCGIFGLGGIGAATARLMYGIGMRVHAINRHGLTAARVDWIGTPERLNDLLEAADVLLISTPLTRATCGLIGAAELSRMKEDAILVNLARGEIVQERPLYDHLVRHPRFTACIDAWWVEPVRTASSASINRFSTCRTSSLRRTTRDRVGTRTISPCGARLRIVVAP